MTLRVRRLGLHLDFWVLQRYHTHGAEDGHLVLAAYQGPVFDYKDPVNAVLAGLDLVDPAHSVLAQH